MKKTSLMILISISQVFSAAFAEGEQHMRQVRTYMSYTWPIDPTKIITLSEMDLSYGLAATLTEWGKDKQIVSGLASKWQIIGGNKFRFTLRDGAKWSNGGKVTSQQVKASLEYGAKAHPEDWRSFVQIVSEISCPSEHEIEFDLKVPADKSNFLGKLTEPNYGIINLSSSHLPNTAVSTGPFFLKKGAENELELESNKNWIHFSNGVVDQIVIRRLPSGEDPQTALLKDKWPNLLQISSLLPVEATEKFKSGGFGFWNRPTDRIFSFWLSPRLYSEEGKSLARFIYNNISRENVVDGFSGQHITKQMFPKGYQLFDSSFDIAKIKSGNIPQNFANRPLDLLISPERVPPALQKNIIAEIERITGKKPNVISISMSQLTASYKKGDYDFYVGTIGLADPDVEGLMSFYLENDVKFIPPINENYLVRLDEARKVTNLEQKLKLMRSILTDATYHGHFVPLFHLSTMGVARGEIDLTQIPETDESVTLSKIRFKDAQ